MSRFLFRLKAASLAAVLAGSGWGCQSHRALREGNYQEVTPENLHEASSSEAKDIPDALAALLRARLEKKADISEEQAIEAVISLGKTGQPRHASTLEAVLKSDPSADARYFAAESLGTLAPEKLRERAPKLLETEQDPVVRQRLEASLKP
jgi:HEAT repeat protein